MKEVFRCVKTSLPEKASLPLKIFIERSSKRCRISEKEETQKGKLRCEEYCDG